MFTVRSEVVTKRIEMSVFQFQPLLSKANDRMFRIEQVGKSLQAVCLVRCPFL